MPAHIAISVRLPLSASGVSPPPRVLSTQIGKTYPCKHSPTPPLPHFLTLRKSKVNGYSELNRNGDNSTSPEECPIPINRSTIRDSASR